MGLSIADKTFWIEEFGKTLNAAALKLLRESGDLTLVDRAKETARTNILDTLNLTVRMEALEELRRRERELYAAHDQAQKEERDAEDQIKTILAQHYVEGEPNDRYYRNTHSINDMLSQLVNRQYVDVLREMGETGQKIAEMADMKQNIERTVMLATSTNAIKNFAMKFYEKFGIKINTDLL